MTLVANAWIGTTVPQSILLEKVVEWVIQTGKTVTLAVKTEIPLPGDVDKKPDLDDWDEEAVQ